MTAIFGFLDEKCIEMEIFIITSWLFRIMTSLKLCQLYRDLYGKMAFWPQWRHQWEELKLQSPITREDKQLLRCVFFVRLVFMSTSKYLDRKKHGSSPLRAMASIQYFFLCSRELRLGCGSSSFEVLSVCHLWNDWMYWTVGEIDVNDSILYSMK